MLPAQFSLLLAEAPNLRLHVIHLFTERRRTQRIILNGQLMGCIVFENRRNVIKCTATTNSVPVRHEGIRCPCLENQQNQFSDVLAWLR